MARHGLQLVKSSRSDALEPEVLDGNGAMSSSAGKTFGVSPEIAQGLMRMASKVMDGRHEIDLIRANSDKEVARIAKEIDRVVQEAEADVKRLHAESEIWHGKFDARRKMTESLLSRLDSHPEWSDEIRKKIIDLALAEFNVS